MIAVFIGFMLKNKETILILRINRLLKQIYFTKLNLKGGRNMDSNKVNENIPNTKTGKEIAEYRNCYKLYAVMQVMLDKELIKKEEIEEAYLKVANSVLDYFEDEDNKREILKPVF